MNAKRILALVGVIVLVGLYLATLIFAIIGSPQTMKFFMISAASTVAIPLIIHIFMTMNNVRRGKSIWDNPYPYRDKEGKDK